MISFTLSLVALIVGYILYGAFIERMVAPDPNKVTVAVAKADGVDYVPMPAWRIFMIQFLNIAGLGPIFGAIMGAKFGIASYIWIVIGTIFAGAVHDYIAAMISLRNDGESLPESIGRYLGPTVRNIMRIFTVVLLVLVGAVFVAAPAGLLGKLTVGYNAMFTAQFWIVVVFVYYLIATLLPIDKLIGHLYPIFAIALLFMAAGVLVMLYVNASDMPEFTDWAAGITEHPDGLPIFPMMFISIACGAISGFHASQSPMMARCIQNEKLGRPIFYGAMVAEGIVALIWAAAATYFFQENGFGESNAAVVVNTITSDWLGGFGAVLAMLGVIFAPITSGDTALRSARLIIADTIKYEQRSIRSRLIITIPLFFTCMTILGYSLSDANGFNVVWRYFAWSNQMMSVFTLWMITAYLLREGKNYFVSLLPALFMTAVTTCYIFVAPEGFGLDIRIGYGVALLSLMLSIVAFLKLKNNINNQ